LSSIAHVSVHYTVVPYINVCLDGYTDKNQLYLKRFVQFKIQKSLLSCLQHWC